MDMRSILSKIFLLSLLLGVAGASIQAGELYPWQLTRDSLLLFEGSTYRYTVDTPENEGLSSTLPSVEALKEQLAHSGSGVYRFLLLPDRRKQKVFRLMEIICNQLLKSVCW